MYCMHTCGSNKCMHIVHSDTCDTKTITTMYHIHLLLPHVCMQHIVMISGPVLPYMQPSFRWCKISLELSICKFLCDILGGEVNRWNDFYLNSRPQLIWRGYGEILGASIKQLQQANESLRWILRQALQLQHWCSWPYHKVIFIPESSNVSSAPSKKTHLYVSKSRAYGVYNLS